MCKSSANGSLSGNKSLIQERNSPNGRIYPEFPLEPINYREDIELDDRVLIAISIKELNRRLTEKGIGEARQKEIKCDRRTLKSRGT